MNIAFGTVFGGGLHVASGAIGDAISRVQYKTREAALRVSVAQLAEGNRVNVEPILKLDQAAYHGSPYKFDKFSLEHMGQGEGAQGFGHGLYFAKRKDIAEFYRRSTSDSTLKWSDPSVGADHPPSVKVAAENYLELANGNVQVAAARLRADFQESGHEIYKVASDLLYNEQLVPAGELYRVAIPDDNMLLDWDKPLKDQSDNLKASLKTIINETIDVSASDELEYRGLKSYMDDPNYTFKDFYEHETRYGDYAPDELSDMLRDAGFLGHKYLDNPSRLKGEGSHNYVIYDDKAVKILEGGTNKKAVTEEFPDPATLNKMFKQEDVEASLEDGMRLSEQVDAEVKAKPARTSNKTRELEEDLAETMSRVDEMRNSGELDPEREAIMLEAERTTQEVNTIAHAVESAANCIATKLSI